MYGFIFSDLILHSYMIEREKGNKPTSIGPESNTRSIISSSTKKDGKRTIELVEKQETYSPLLLANSSPLPPEILQSARKPKMVTPLLTCLRALWEFENTMGHPPTHSKEQLVAFTKVATEKHRELQLPRETLRSDFLRSFVQNLGAELAPVTALLGGMLAQDAINVLGGREQPIQNLVLFDGENDKGQMFAMHPMVSMDDALVAGTDMDLGAGLDNMPIPLTDPSMSMMGGMDTTGMNMNMGLDMSMGMGMPMDMTNMNGMAGFGGVDGMGGMGALNNMGTIDAMGNMTGMDMGMLGAVDPASMPADAGLGGEPGLNDALPPDATIAPPAATEDVPTTATETTDTTQPST